MEATAWQSPPIGPNSEIADLRVKRPVFDERQDIVDVRVEVIVLAHLRHVFTNEVISELSASAQLRVLFTKVRSTQIDRLTTGQNLDSQNLLQEAEGFAKSQSGVGAVGHVVLLARRGRDAESRMTSGQTHHLHDKSSY